MSCRIPECVRDITNDLPEFCAKHSLARENLDKSFKEWKLAYGKSYTFSMYLDRLINDETIGAGEWIQDIAIFLSKNQLIDSTD